MKNARVLLIGLVLLSLGCNNIGNGLTNIGPSVGGQVFDAATNQPVTGATVSVAGRMGQTAFNGVFYIPDVGRGAHVLKVTKEGYAEYSVEITINDSTVSKTIHLSR